MTLGQAERALRDIMYTLLLGLDVAASIGRDQHTFRDDLQNPIGDQD
jgi:hypothetical protein